MDMKTPGAKIEGCPMGFDGGVRALLGRQNQDWWPNQLQLNILSQGGTSPDPMGEDFNYSRVRRTAGQWPFFDLET